MIKPCQELQIGDRKDPKTYKRWDPWESIIIKDYTHTFQKIKCLCDQS